jgi:hypothetical protein
MTMTNSITKQQQSPEISVDPTLFGRGTPTWKKVLAALLAAAMVGMWIFIFRSIIASPLKPLHVRVTLLSASTVVTLLIIIYEHVLIPGVISRALKRIGVTAIVGVLALYVLSPAIAYVRGDDDICIASFYAAPQRDIGSAKRTAATLNVLKEGKGIYRIEVSKRDFARLRGHGFAVQIVQTPEHRYRAALVSARPPGIPDGRVEQIIHLISSDSLLGHIRRLERFGTRVNLSPQADSAAEYIVNAMKQYGLEVESLPFDCTTPPMQVDEVGVARVSRNICGTMRGVGGSDAECIIVAHYDSAHPLAPGANDNASGVAVVLEAARICSGYRFAHTIRFLAVGAEEIGLVGSDRYAREAKANGRHIITVVNGDMLGYPLMGDPARVFVSAGTSCQYLMDSMLVYNRRYNLNFLIDGQIGGVGGSDHESFLRAGYPAVDISEGSALEIWNRMDPYYHLPTDTSDKLDAELLRHCAQLMLAAVTEMARPLAFRPGHVR